MPTIAPDRGVWVGRARTLAFCVLALVVAVSLGVLAAGPAHADTFTVDSIADLEDVTLDGDCDANVGLANPCTLRAAIQEANFATGADSINFEIPGDGPHTISPSSQLPTTTGPVRIDGYTEGDTTAATTDDAKENTLAFGTNADLKIVISGTNAPDNTNGLVISGGRTTVRGLVINGFPSTNGIFGGTAVVLSSAEGNVNNVIAGNFIGTNSAGTAAAPNEKNGVFVAAGSTGNTLGGETPSSRNLISGNVEEGIEFQSADANTVRGNLVGTDRNGTADLGNGSDGIRTSTFSTAVKGNVITDNVIAFNDGDGVLITNTRGERILTNSIFSNEDLGIDLGSGGREQDNKDPDTGANNNQNYPSIASATSSGTATTIKGTLNSKPRKTFTIQLFQNPVLTNEGKTFLGQMNVTTNRKGKASFSYFGPALTTGQEITATATGTDGTSEFSDTRAVGAAA